MLGINDRAFTYIYIYVYIYIILHGSVCDPGFHAFCIRYTCLTNAKCMKPRVADSTMLYTLSFPGLSPLAKELTASTRVMESSSNEFHTPESANAKCKTNESLCIIR